MNENIHQQLEALTVPIDELRHMDGNPRLGNIAAVRRSYETFGQRKPIVARADTHEVIAGNHQLAAARQLGWDRIAVIFCDDDDLTAIAFSLADNKTGDLGTYNQELLTEIIAELTVDETLLAATAYSEREIAGMLGETVGLGMDESEAEIDIPKISMCPQCGYEYVPGA